MLSRCLLGAGIRGSSVFQLSRFATVRQSAPCYRFLTSQSARQIYTKLGTGNVSTKPFPKQSLPSLLSFVRRCTSQAGKSASQRAYPDISEHAQKVVGRWLALCAGLVWGTLFVGGVTRLTESGLSITKWNPISGTLPPLSAQQWQEKFDMYKEYPEFKYLERELTLSDFKFIYFMEWFHRNWGRATGLIFALPAAYYWKKGYLAKSMKPRVLAYAGLFLAQAVMGIVMVNSGLDDKKDEHEIPRVSQYRLASHLGLALILYVGFLWSAFTHLLPPHQNVAKYMGNPAVARLRGISHGAMSLVFFTALSGAFVAGLDAGLVYNNWPKMADRWIPTDIAALEPKWLNLFENHTTVQFTHRHLGELTGVVILGLWYLTQKTPLPPRAKLAANAFGAMAALQISLGIATLLMYVPTWLAATHQSGSVALLTLAAWLANEIKRIPK